VKTRAILGLGALALGSAASCSNLNLPTPPMAAQTAALAAAYDMPTGSIDIAAVQGVLGSISREIPNFQLDWFPEVATKLLTSLDQRIQGSGLPDNPDASVETHHFIVSAVVDLHRICEGWDDPASPPSSANGTIDATAVVEHGRLDPEVWGTATSCKINLSLLDGSLTGNVMFDGPVILYLLGPLPTSASNARFLFQFNGQLQVGGQSDNSSIDFRVFDGTLAFRLRVSDGDVIVEPPTTGTTGSTVTLRASNGVFFCDLSTGSCQ
jgi:hypothetical protein